MLGEVICGDGRTTELGHRALEHSLNWLLEEL